jgi:hypothetical protein
MNNKDDLGSLWKWFPKIRQFHRKYFKFIKYFNFEIISSQPAIHLWYVPQNQNSQEKPLVMPYAFDLNRIDETIGWNVLNVTQYQLLN